ncbi:DUF6436 domain-containing protein [Pseudoalteromonas gelatinilytica]
MLNSNSKWVIVATLVWVASVVLALVFAYSQQASTFDPDKKLAAANWLPTFQQSMELGINNIDTLYIIDENTCVCSARSQPHISSLSSYAAEQGVEVIKLKPKSAVAAILPAQPAAVLVSENQQLVYAGPLSKGLACSSQNGFVELVIANLRAGFNSQFINSDAEGCYCEIH